MYKFLCQGCLTVLLSNNWEKYHIHDDSSPCCCSDMCGCNECLSYIQEYNLKIKYIDKELLSKIYKKETSKFRNKTKNINVINLQKWEFKKFR